MRKFVSLIAISVFVLATGCTERFAPGVPHPGKVLQDLPEIPDAPNAETAVSELSEIFDFDFDISDIESDVISVDSIVYVIIVENAVVLKMSYFLVQGEWIPVAEKIEL